MVDYAAYGVRTAGKAGIERPPELTLSLFPSAKTQRGSSWRLAVGYGIKMRMGMLARNPCSVVPGISGRKTSLVRKAPVRLGRLLGCLPSLIPASPDIGGAPPCKGRLFNLSSATSHGRSSTRIWKIAGGEVIRLASILATRPYTEQQNRLFCQTHDSDVRA